MLLIFLAGLCGGGITGFFGGSATLVVVPLLVTFGGYHPYAAIGLALSIDIFSSLSAFRIYNHRTSIHLKSALPLIVSAVIGVVTGSSISVTFPEKILAALVGAGVLLVSLRFLSASANTGKPPAFLSKYGKHASIIWGVLSGLGLGIVGGGGGVVLLMGLTILLRYPLHQAVGVSVLGMTFIALVGAFSHYLLMPFSLLPAGIGAVGGISGAMISSRIANRTPEIKLNIIIGLFLAVLSLTLLTNTLFLM
jgi:uncharacterized membrane protein YfcA